jgi:hypothetical protein
MRSGFSDSYHLCQFWMFERIARVDLSSVNLQTPSTRWWNSTYLTSLACTDNSDRYLLLLLPVPIPVRMSI